MASLLYCSFAVLRAPVCLHCLLKRTLRPNDASRHALRTERPGNEKKQCRAYRLSGDTWDKSEELRKGGLLQKFRALFSAGPLWPLSRYMRGPRLSCGPPVHADIYIYIHF